MSEKILRAGVFGWPVEHSKSPKLHGFWLNRYGVDGSYVLLPARPEDFESEVRRLAAAGWRGANVTIPHKEAALSLADRATDRARAIGAANTLIFDEGEIVADNTDGFGFIENVRAGSPWRSDRPAAILGAGGAARAIIWSLIEAGAPEIRLTNRTRDRAMRLADELRPKVRIIDWDDRASGLDGAGLIVNTTSLGMTGQPPLELDLSVAPPDAVATDIVYTPLITPFLTAARARDLPVVDGLGMLLHQARPGFEAWFGVAPEVDDALREVILAS
ncbi:MAG: shikimate dehydrogenase [Pseudomonadota bacterium]